MTNSKNPRNSVCRAAAARQFGYVLLIAVSVLGGVSSAMAAKWEPVPAADLAATESAVFPGADAEILLSERRQDFTAEMTMPLFGAGPSLETRGDYIAVTGRGGAGGRVDVRERYKNVVENFIRVKIYTAEGVKKYERTEVVLPTIRPPVSRTSDGESAAGRMGIVADGAERPRARVVKPDGSSIELTDANIVERREDGDVDSSATFIFPRLVPGDIVEYRWATTQAGLAGPVQISCQGPVPLREYRFTVGSLPTDGTLAWINCATAGEVREARGSTVVLRNLPAFERETYMPGLWDDQTIVFVLPNVSTRWLGLGAQWSREFDEATSPDKTIRAKAAELIAGATNDDEKLLRLYAFCQGEMENLDRADTPEAKEKREEARKLFIEARKYRPELIRAALEARAGDARMIDLVFAALARGAGYAVHQTRSADKNRLSKPRDNLGWAFLTRRLVAVDVGGHWRYFAPGSYLLPYDMLPSVDEGVIAMWIEGKSVQSARTPVSSAGRTQVQRKARFTLDDEGTLEGEGEESYTGHLAIEHKERCWGKSDAEAVERFRGAVIKRLPRAELSAVLLTNLRTPALPLTVRYRIKVPGYATQTGRRLVVVPSFFEAGEAVVFTANERKFPIAFPYAWGEHDDIEIVLPEGYTLDNPSAPVKVGDGGVALGASYQIQFNGRTRTLAYKRDFTLGGNGITTFRTESYPLVKRLFEQLSASDSHVIVIKPKEPAGTATP